MRFEVPYVHDQAGDRPAKRDARVHIGRYRRLVHFPCHGARRAV